MKQAIQINDKKYTVTHSTLDFINLMAPDRMQYIRELDLSNLDFNGSTADDFDVLNLKIQQCERLEEIKTSAHNFNLSINKLPSLIKINRLIITDISKSFQIPKYLTNLETVKLSTIKNDENTNLKIYFPKELTQLSNIDVSDISEIGHLEIPSNIAKQVECISCNGLITVYDSKFNNYQVDADTAKFIKRIQNNMFFDTSLDLHISDNPIANRNVNTAHLIIDALSVNDQSAARIKKIVIIGDTHVFSNERTIYDPTTGNYIYPDEFSPGQHNEDSCNINLPNNLINLQEFFIQDNMSVEDFNSEDLPENIRRSVKSLDFSSTFIADLTLDGMPALESLYCSSANATINIKNCENLKIAHVNSIDTFSGENPIPQSLEFLQLNELTAELNVPNNLTKLKALFISHNTERENQSFYKIFIPRELTKLRKIYLKSIFAQQEDILNIAEDIVKNISILYFDGSIYEIFDANDFVYKNIDYYDPGNNTYIKSAITYMDVLLKQKGTGVESEPILKNILSFVDPINYETSLLTNEIALVNNNDTKLSQQLKDDLDRANTNIASKVLNSPPAQIILSKSRIKDYAKRTATTSSNEPPRKKIRHSIS